MIAKSLRLRLSIAAAVSLAIALSVAGVALVFLFERQVERRIGNELDTYIRQISANVSIEPDGSLHFDRPLADPRFEQPLSGLYWQIVDDTSGAKLRSRSLWDHVIGLPDHPLEPGAVHHHDMVGPSGETLFTSERRIVYPVGASARRLRITVGLDRKEINDARSEFIGDVAASLAILAVVLLLASWGQIVIGLWPLEALRRSVNAVRSGRQKTIAVDEPEEIMPLVDEVNSLLEARAKAVESAKARAANLAHGLKTPLTVLTTDAERLRRKGEMEIADELQELAFGMRRLVNRELSKARLQSSPGSVGQGVAVRSVIEGIAKTLSRSPRGSGLSWRIEVSPDAFIDLSEEDATELFGVLLDNAVKWTQTEIRVTSQSEDRRLRVDIEDDGPGVPSEQITRLGQRGLRFDETTEGTGLGLSIAADIIEAYAGEMTFAVRLPRGLCVSVILPRRA
ncbi:sensor histidine kinase [Methylosinus sporium]|jgi:signal transduction histidine kinase|uniref:sensor histidine kinase n=1 Tax=Methylosinus sporium TaxID=428 RepID=UPI000D5929CE|nr:HAMP domain-containing sensor histidine kinase [Methylosinus sporium]PWB88848.1 sensor histidine kinase [Methylocystis sp. MitZ-2018]